MPTEDAPANDPRPTPAPASPKPNVKTESSVEEAVEVVAAQVVKSKNPLLALVVMISTTLLTGGGVALGGWNAQGAITAQVDTITKKLDELGKELVETRKVLDSMRAAETAAVARAQAERHEERIRKLEDGFQESQLERAKLVLEVEALKRAPK